VLDRAALYRGAFERDPIGFVTRELEPGIDRARAAAAALLGAEAADVVFVKNATTGVNTVLASLDMHGEDEIIVTNHGYGACTIAAEDWAARLGARVVTAEVPFPISSSYAVVEAVLARVTPKTRLALVDHVTSPTGLVFPVKEIVEALHARGVEVLVDGAHAPGMLPLDLSTLGADYYTGNFHKWCCTPKGTAFLWVKKELQARIHPLVRSHGARSKRTDRSRFQLEFDWVGTDDPSAMLTLPYALELVGDLVPGGWDAIRTHNRELVLRGRSLLLDAVGGEPPCPDEMIGSLVAVCLPDAPHVAPAGWPFAEPLYTALRDRHGIEALPLHFPAPPKQIVRASAHLYNDLEDFRALARALRAELE
jgi:isopenicillin-N epimerase